MREAVGLFKNMEQLQEAVKELERTEFPRDALSVIGSHDEIQAKFGAITLSAELAQDDKDVPRESPVRSEEKTIGATALVGGSAYVGAMAVALAAGAVTMPGILAAVAIGGVSGAAIGGVLTKLLGDHYEAEMEDQIRSGGLLLWIRTPDPHREDLACQILNNCGATNVKIHEL